MNKIAVPAHAQYLLDVIAGPEATKAGMSRRDTYDTVYGFNQDSMPKPVTSMTIGECRKDGPRRTRNYGSSAAGRYQFMPNTLKSLIGSNGVTDETKLTPENQDRLAYLLLVRRGYNDFIAGRITMTVFGLGLAKEWASFPVLAAVKGQKRRVSRGESFYSGDGLNKSHITPAQVERALRATLERVGGAVKVVPIASPPVTPPAEVEAEPVAAEPEVKPITDVKLDTREPGKLASLWDLIRGKPSLPKATYPQHYADPERNKIHYVQSRLKELGFTEVGELDGLIGNRTNDAVRLARAYNGMYSGDGPEGYAINDEFLAKLPTMKGRIPSIERGTADEKEVAPQFPDLFARLKRLRTLGFSGLAVATAGGSKSTGLLDSAQGAADELRSTAENIGNIARFAIQVINFGLNYWWAILGFFAIWILLERAASVGKFILLYRQGRAL